MTAPAGYRLLRSFDLSHNEGWVLDSGKPSNADGVDRPANCQFGQGPGGTSARLLISREGSTVYTCDARATFQAVPNYHWVRWVIEKDAMEAGVWPGLWARPLGAGEGEIDHWEEFYANSVSGLHYPVDAGTLHTTPYDGTHKQVQRAFPSLTGAGTYTIEFELAPGVARWYVGGTKVAEVTKAQFDVTSSGRWDAMFGTESKNWYMRMTQQAGGVGGGPIPSTFDQWQVLVHELSVFVPDAATTTTTGRASVLWLGGDATAPTPPSDVPIATDQTYSNRGYSYTGTGDVEYSPTVEADPANRTRQPVRRIHESLPAPTLVNGRPR